MPCGTWLYVPPRWHLIEVYIFVLFQKIFVVELGGKIGGNETLLLSNCLVVSDSCNPMNCSTPDLCPSLSPGACSNACPLSQWCHPTISSSVVPFSCLQSFPTSGAFPVSQLFASGGLSIGGSLSSSVLPVNIQGWFPLRLTGLILQSRGLSRVFSSTSLKASVSWHSAFFMVQLSYLYLTRFMRCSSGKTGLCEEDKGGKCRI